MSLEKDFDASFATALALKEKQIQQNYRPIIGIHKWFARRPGTIFRTLLFAEFNGEEPFEKSYWRAPAEGVIADPFMGGGTPIYEANRLGFHVVGTDINPMAYWVVRQSLAPLDLAELLHGAAGWCVTSRRRSEIFTLPSDSCGNPAAVKYFIWVKTATCPHCQTENDLFPGYLLAEAVRHPQQRVVRRLRPAQRVRLSPHPRVPGSCRECGHAVHVRHQRGATRGVPKMRASFPLVGGLEAASEAPDVGDRVSMPAMQADPQRAIFQAPGRG